MQWIRAHPYTSATVFAALILLAGALFIKERMSVPPNTSSVTAWGGTGAGFLHTSLGGILADTGNTEPSLYQAVQSGPPFSYIPYTSEETSGSVAADFDLAALIAQLSGPRASGESGANGESGSAFSDAYSFIPSGLIAATTVEQERTPLQQSLYWYGNEAGFIIKTFEDRNHGMARILKDQFEDPHNPQKNASLIALAEAMEEVGDSLLRMENVPQTALSAHARVAGSYKEMGEVLALIPNAERDQERIDAMLAYNATVEEYVKNYVGLATIFSIAEVKFRPVDAGSVFIFSSGGF